jgi:hypothetical protein
MATNESTSIEGLMLSDFADIAAQWHPTRNGTLTPDQIVAGSHRKVWWKCPVGPDHEWEAPLERRTRVGTGCPYCSGQRVSVSNALASLRPDIAAQWHPTQNGALTPDQIVAGSHRKVWWKCSEGPDHEWATQLSSRTDSGTGCPYCSGKKLSVTNSLASLRPDLEAQWHPTHNGDLSPNQVVAGSAKKIWWKCTEGPDQTAE